MAIVYKTHAELEKMRAANQVVCSVLDAIEEMIRPGITTQDISDLADSLVEQHKVVPAFLNYGTPPFPSVVCVSVNDVIVHGIPSAQHTLVEGDIVGVDFGVAKDGYYGDSARTFAVGNIDPEAQRLLDVTKQSLEAAIGQCVVGKRIRDIGRAVQEVVEGAGFSVVRDFVGHGIGRRMHEEPPVPNYVATGNNPRLRAGMVLAIEPMVNVGEPDVSVDDDRWTARTKDGTLSAHFEHSIAIRDEGPWVLSRVSGQPE